MVHCPTLKGMAWVHLTFQIDFLYYIGIQHQVQNDILKAVLYITIGTDSKWPNHATDDSKYSVEF